MMPGATPPIAGLGAARQAQRSCRALGLCQLHKPRCLDCLAPATAPATPSETPPPSATIIDITAQAWVTRQAPQALRAALDEMDDPDADAGLGRAILRGLAWAGVTILLVLNAAVGLGYAWTRWVAP